MTKRIINSDLQQEDTMQSKQPVTEHALILRLKRQLRRDNLILHKTHRPDSNFGNYYVAANGAVVHVIHNNSDLEQFGRERGVLQPYECLSAYLVDTDPGRGQ
jgi:hypothetical protein